MVARVDDGGCGRSLEFEEAEVGTKMTAAAVVIIADIAVVAAVVANATVLDSMPARIHYQLPPWPQKYAVSLSEEQ